MDGHRLGFGNVVVDIADPSIDRLGEPCWPLVRAFLEDTYSACSYYRRRLDRHGTTPDAIRTLDDFRRIPLLSPVDVGGLAEQALLPDRVADATRTGLHTFAPHERFAKKFATSATMGPAKVSYYTADDWAAQLAVVRRQLSDVPRERWSRPFVSFNPGHFAGKLQEDALNRAGCAVESRRFTALSPRDVLDQMIASTLNAVGGFNALVGTPCAAHAGAAKGVHLDALLDADADNYIGRHIEIVITGGTGREAPGLDLRARVWEANEIAGRRRAEFREIYGCSEIGAIAAECEANDGLHVENGAALVEVIDPATGQHAVDGGRGLVVVTGLRHGTRFMRYVLGDEATYVTAHCACGRGSPRLKQLARVLDRGRLDFGCAAG